MTKFFSILFITAALFSAVVAGNLRDVNTRSYGTVGGWSSAPLDDPYAVLLCDS